MDSMVGTLTPEQMAQLILQQQALSGALRDSAGTGMPLAQNAGGQVQSATGGFSQGINDGMGLADKFNRSTGPVKKVDWPAILRQMTGSGQPPAMSQAATDAGFV